MAHMAPERLQGMALLTGPNMAGKSTILRSVCAVALLGACGLYAPAGSANVPYFGAQRCSERARLYGVASCFGVARCG